MKKEIFTLKKVMKKKAVPIIYMQVELRNRNYLRLMLQILVERNYSKILF